MIKILTIPFSKKDETFFEDEVNQFLLNKKIRTTKAELKKIKGFGKKTKYLPGTSFSQSSWFFINPVDKLTFW